MQLLLKLINTKIIIILGVCLSRATLTNESKWNLQRVLVSRISNMIHTNKNWSSRSITPLITAGRQYIDQSIINTSCQGTLHVTINCTDVNSCAFCICIFWYIFLRINLLVNYYNGNCNWFLIKPLNYIINILPAVYCIQ